MRGERYAFPEGQKITDAYRDTRKSEHQRDHEVQSIFSQSTCADDDIGGRQPENDPENQGYTTENKGIFYKAGGFHQNDPEAFERPVYFLFSTHHLANRKRVMQTNEETTTATIPIYFRC